MVQAFDDSRVHESMKRIKQESELDSNAPDAKKQKTTEIKLEDSPPTEDTITNTTTITDTPSLVRPSGMLEVRNTTTTPAATNSPAETGKNITSTKQQQGIDKQWNLAKKLVQLKQKAKSRAPNNDYAQIDVDIESIREHCQALQHYRKLDLVNDSLDGWKIKGIGSTLFDHQIIAIGWGLMREKGMEEEKSGGEGHVRGGFIADTMGAGKSLEAVGIALSNPPLKKAGRRNFKATTLVVTTKSGVTNWMQEIDQHCDDVDCRIYDKKTETAKSLWVADFLIIGYNELRTLYTRGIKDGTPAPPFEAKTNFYRIILDEAHEIKNGGTKTSSACLALNSEYKWCLTATPMPNGLQDLYAPLQFLGANGIVKNIKSGKTFKEKYNGADPSSMKLSDLTGPLSMKRDGDASLLGQRILQLPDAHECDVMVDLSVEEQIVYE